MERFVEPSSEAFEIDPFKKSIKAILKFYEKVEIQGHIWPQVNLVLCA